MIIKGRSHTMIHVSRTHRVALDWLFDRINLQPKIQIKYVDTKKTTRVDRRKCKRWVELSSFVVKHHDFLNVSCSHFQQCSDSIRKQCTKTGRVQKATWKRQRQWRSRSLWILNLSSIRKVPSKEVRDPSSLAESKFGPVWCLSTQLKSVCEGHQRWPDNVIFNRGN